jgi:DNA replication and repair protein RecF
VTLATLEVRNFRCIESCAVELDSKCTLIVGENAAGKTSLLEALHVLSCGRSFRTNRAEDLVKTGQSCLQIAGTINEPASLRVGTELSASSRLVSVGGERTNSFAELAVLLPVLVIDPSMHRLLEDGPSRRRRLLDWGTFHVEPRFIDKWRRYQRALRNRNAALKGIQPSEEIQNWDNELVEAGVVITQFRSSYFEELNPVITRIAEQLLGLPVRCVLRPGWDDATGFASALSTAWNRDRKQRVTTVGPHRADIEITVGGFAGKDYVSRGQQKLLAGAFALAQLECHAKRSARNICLLLDDPAAELDVDNLRKLLAMVRSIPAQLLVTAIDRSQIEMLSPGKMFHVKQGSVRQMV